MSAWLLHLAEARHGLHKCILHHEDVFYEMSDMLWMVPVTMMTVGYGDVTPKSAVGKTICIFVGAYGLVVSARIVIKYANKTKMTKRERIVYNQILKREMQEKVRVKAAIFIQRAWRNKRPKSVLAKIKDKMHLCCGLCLPCRKAISNIETEANSPLAKCHEKVSKFKEDIATKIDVAIVNRISASINRRSTQQTRKSPNRGRKSQSLDSKNNDQNLPDDDDNLPSNSNSELDEHEDAERRKSYIGRLNCNALALKTSEISNEPRPTSQNQKQHSISCAQNLNLTNFTGSTNVTGSSSNMTDNRDQTVPLSNNRNSYTSIDIHSEISACLEKDTSRPKLDHDRNDENSESENENDNNNQTKIDHSPNLCTSPLRRMGLCPRLELHRKGLITSRSVLVAMMDFKQARLDVKYTLTDSFDLLDVGIRQENLERKIDLLDAKMNKIIELLVMQSSFNNKNNNSNNQMSSWQQAQMRNNFIDTTEKLKLGMNLAERKNR